MNAVDTRLTPPVPRHPDRLLIGGAWVDACAGGMIDVVSPDTEAVVARVAEAGVADMDAAVGAARAAFDDGGWSGLPAAERIAVLRSMAAGLKRREGELGRAWSAQVGGLAAMAGFVTASGTADFVNALDVAERFALTRAVASGAAPAVVLAHEPVGVVAAIAPWNTPYGLMTRKVAPALAVGCTVVMKPAPETPLEAYIMAECAQDAGLPAGVLNLVTGGRAASDHLVRHAGVDKVSFTGSTVVGRRIAAVCAERMARVTLELGGKSAAIVLADYPMEDAAAMLTRTITILSGQVCSTLSRALVPRARHDALAACLVGAMAAIRVGHSWDPAAQMGPLAGRRQLERVEAYVAAGVAEGARLATGGRRPAHLTGGCFIEPTLFTDVDPAMSIAQEEIFGPVLCLIPYDDEDHAVRIANDTIYGLNGAVLTHDADAAWRIGKRMRSGRFVQNVFSNDALLPSGGFKQSGIGREGGEAGLLSYLESKVLLLEQMPDGLGVSGERI